MLFLILYAEMHIGLVAVFKFYHKEPWFYRDVSYSSADECSLEKRRAIPSTSIITIRLTQTLIDHVRSNSARREHHFSTNQKTIYCVYIMQE
jgi:hypothetical protein